jgi:hypothetical protein
LKPEQKKPSSEPVVMDLGKAKKLTRGFSVGFTSEQGWPPYDRYPG